MGSVIEFARNGRRVGGYLAKPQGAGPFPAVIVIQEWWGLNEHIKNVAERYAREGYVALAPDLYHGKVTADPNEAGKLMGALNREEAVKDLLGAVQHLKALKEVRGDRIGVTGFCMGGSYALLLPCRTKDIRAAAPYYGEIPDEAALRNLACPILYVYGDADFWITKDEVKRLEASLKKLGKPGEVKIYPGAPHAFFNDTRKDVYRQKEAQDAWRRTLDFFSK
ncbi:MAG: dienelactone hydrolase family protein, partial [Candidatus Rokubacteria bacterium]|nr:dienelactone hydrolase family protein [Candidatus Rokubacteria bacterium]